jgi:hypothetical protein
VINLWNVRSYYVIGDEKMDLKGALEVLEDERTV